MSVKQFNGAVDFNKTVVKGSLMAKIHLVLDDNCGGYFHVRSKPVGDRWTTTEDMITLTMNGVSQEAILGAARYIERIMGLPIVEAVTEMMEIRKLTK